MDKLRFGQWEFLSDKLLPLLKKLNEDSDTITFSDETRTVGEVIDIIEGVLDDQHYDKFEKRILTEMRVFYKHFKDTI